MIFDLSGSANACIDSTGLAVCLDTAAIVVAGQRITFGRQPYREAFASRFPKTANSCTAATDIAVVAPSSASGSQFHCK
jgi:hypothetical protein